MKDQPFLGDDDGLEISKTIGVSLEKVLKIDIRKSLHRKCVGRRSNFLITNNIYSIVFTLLKLCMYLPISSINHYGACSPGLEGENSSKSLEIQCF